ncbi:hypothetical protein SAMN06298215_1545 [Bacteroidales bacterium WCE2008]|nr:hypothetical protein SAMN06298215_1545 [Bacteroidales bacterium WCE2008]
MTYGLRTGNRCWIVRTGKSRPDKEMCHSWTSLGDLF